MTDKEKLDAIKEYLTTTKKALRECQKFDHEYTTTLGNGVNCSEAGQMFREVEEEIGKILKSK